MPAPRINQRRGRGLWDGPVERAHVAEGTSRAAGSMTEPVARTEPMAGGLILLLLVLLLLLLLPLLLLLVLVVIRASREAVEGDVIDDASDADGAERGEQEDERDVQEEDVAVACASTEVLGLRLRGAKTCEALRRARMASHTPFLNSCSLPTSRGSLAPCNYNTNVCAHVYITRAECSQPATSQLAPACTS